MNPFGRTALDELHRFGNRHRGGQGKENVNVVSHASNLDGLHFILPGNAAEERPEPVAQIRRDEGATFLGAERHNGNRH